MASKVRRLSEEIGQAARQVAIDQAIDHTHDRCRIDMDQPAEQVLQHAALVAHGDQGGKLQG
jgi:hypothetical protein